jgi:hypothetical protein
LGIGNHELAGNKTTADYITQFAYCYAGNKDETPHPPPASCNEQ